MTEAHPVTEATPGTGTFTPRQAAETLHGLQRYEETLTARAFGVSMIAFGMGGGATTMTYAYASGWFVAAGLPWLLSFLWIPWILAAGALTAIVWQTQAITLRRPGDTRGSWLYFLGFSLLYIGLMGLVYWLDTRVALGLGEANRNLLTFAVFTVALATVFGVRYGFGPILRILYGIAAVMAVAAFAYVPLGWSGVPATLLAVATGSGLWVGSGIVIAWRG